MSPFDIPVFQEITELPEPEPVKKRVRAKRGVAAPKLGRPRLDAQVPTSHPDRVPPRDSNWKTARPYQHNIAMRDALERARAVQPGLVSIFNKPEE